MGVGGGEVLRNREEQREYRRWESRQSYGDEREQGKAGRMWAEQRETGEQINQTGRKCCNDTH